MDNGFVEAIQVIEKDTELPTGFLASLLEPRESDWSFVIKVSAVVEAAIAQLLTTATMDARLAGVFRRLDTMDKEKGKVAFLKAMNLLSDHRHRFIAELAKLRNA